MTIPMKWIEEPYENFLNSEDAINCEEDVHRAKRYYKQVLNFTDLSKRDLKKAYRFVRRLEAYSDYYSVIGLEELVDFYGVAYEYCKDAIQDRENWPEDCHNKFIIWEW